MRGVGADCLWCNIVLRGTGVGADVCGATYAGGGGGGGANCGLLFNGTTFLEKNFFSISVSGTTLLCIISKPE